MQILHSISIFVDRAVSENYFSSHGIHRASGSISGNISDTTASRFRPVPPLLTFYAFLGPTLHPPSALLASVKALESSNNYRSLVESLLCAHVFFNPHNHFCLHMKQLTDALRGGETCPRSQCL